MLIVGRIQWGNFRTCYLMFETGHQIVRILITEFCHFNEIKINEPFSSKVQRIIKVINASPLLRKTFNIN